MSAKKKISKLKKKKKKNSHTDICTHRLFKRVTFEPQLFSIIKVTISV
jgi:hypothetical protein